MKAFIKHYRKYIAFFMIMGLIGGYCVGLYLLDSYPPEMQQQILDQGITPDLMALIIAVQSMTYGLVLGVAGILLSRSLGLWKDSWKLEKKPLFFALLVSFFGGLSLILPDIFFFGKYIPPVMESYAVKPTIPYLLGTVTYGAVIEEVMLRLFAMSFIGWVLFKVFDRKHPAPAQWVLILANIISALLFAAGHLPTTAVLFGITPMILFRCFLLNGGFGLLFGRLYRKHGLVYAMIAHGGCHVVSKLIWILFI